MGNGNTQGLSVNAKTLIIVLLFVNIGFAVKMVKKYYAAKDAGYLREQTLQDQIQKRVMKAFGSAEEMNKIVVEVTQQKEEAEKAVAAIRAQDEKLKAANKELAEAKVLLEAEKARLQKEIWSLEDSLKAHKKQGK
ncbi:MAG: hypothetical protein MRJ65_04570 [Candidatus Brocadiaceae bacterium]|nr:hypothetical protein [Candidatus Brocadiaceae bacterium]